MMQIFAVEVKLISHMKTVCERSCDGWGERFRALGCGGGWLKVWGKGFN